MPESSARPQALHRYRATAGGAAESLAAPTGALTGALDAFRASEGRAEWVADVTPLDIDMGAGRARLQRLATFVGDVGDAFAEADGGDVRTVDDGHLEVLGAERLPDPGGSPGLVRDGDRWILDAHDGGPSTSGAHVQVYERDGEIFARVGHVGDDGTVDYGEPIELTDDQAANLVIRSTDEGDYIELPPTSTVGITVWTGDGNDLVGGSGDAGDVAAGQNPGHGIGGGGSDRLFLGEGDDVAFGGAGDDEIDGGIGSDSIDGQDGDDRLLGGDEFDTLYGGRGDDLIDGGEGTDHLEGGSGDDDLRGGLGDDVVSGGRGDDHLDGGAGDDALFGGRDSDTVSGGDGTDTSTGEDGDVRSGVETHITIELEGDPGSYAVYTPQPDWMSDAEYEAWLERIDSDLELIRSTPSGRQGLAALDDAAGDSDSGWNPFDDDKRIIVVPYGDADRPAWIDTDGDDVDDRAYAVADWLGGQGLPGNYASPPGGADDHHATVSAGGMHNEALDARPPVASIYHELSHSFDQLRGGTPEGTYEEILVDADGNEVDRNDAPRGELNSVGLDIDGDGAIDTVETDGGDEHPAELTENALRSDLGWPDRPSYTQIPDPGEHVEFEGTDE